MTTTDLSQPQRSTEFEGLLDENAKLRHIMTEIDRVAPENIHLRDKTDPAKRKQRLIALFQGARQALQSEGEIDMSAWIYVLQFPNPDSDTTQQRSVTRLEATDIFKQCFLGEESEDAWEERRNLEEELEAFLDVFEGLDNFESGKKFSHGGRIEKDIEGHFLDTGASAHDFLTLMRNVTMVKLTQHLCLNARQVLSSNGENIYIVLFGDEDDFLSEAERTEFNSQLHVYTTDWNSLEPCDKRLRPYRLLIKGAEIDNLIAEVDTLFSRLVPSAEKYKFHESSSFQPTGVTAGHWMTYIEFLNEMKNALLDILKMPEQLSDYEKRTFIGKLVYRSIERLNKERPKFKLKNLWQRLGFSTAVGAYTDFCRNFDTEGNDTFLGLWRTHSSTTSGERSLFRNYEKLKLIRSLINRQVILHSLKRCALMVQGFPLHNDIELSGLVLTKGALPRVNTGEDLLKHVKRRIKASLVNEWHYRHIFDFNTPINGIKNYFGEKIAMYFAFTSFLAKCLIPLGIVGLPLFVVQRTLDYDDPALLTLNAIYCIFIALWGTVVLEFWRRRESRLAFFWGTTDFLQDEVTRPQFKGLQRRSPVTDDLDDLFYSPIKRAISIAIGFFVSVLIILIVIGIVAGLIIMRWKLTKNLMVNGFDGAGPLASVLNAIQIQIFNFLYEFLAFKLTDWENHKTQSSYEKSFIVKSYLFQFVNSYNALFYIAFIKSYTEGCIVKDSEGKKILEVGANCMDELYTQLTSIFLVAYFKNIIELALPFLKNRRRMKTFRNIPFSDSDTDQTCKRIEANLMKSEYMNRSIDGTFAEMLEVCILFGYLTIFAVAFPLGGILAFGELLLELRVDRYKLLWMMRRPEPEGMSDIGIWWSVLQTTLVIAILTNAGLFCFTAHTFEGSLSSSEQFIPFVIIIVCVMAIRGWLQTLIPDVPEELRIVSRRHEAIRTRYLNSWKPAKKDPSKMKEALNFVVALPSL